MGVDSRSRLTGVATHYEDEIAQLNIPRDERLAGIGSPLAEFLEDRSAEVLSKLRL